MFNCKFVLTTGKSPKLYFIVSEKIETFLATQQKPHYYYFQVGLHHMIVVTQ